MARPPGHGPAFQGRRELIIDQAAALFAKRGYAATGIADICRQVNLGKGALYFYIGSKENLLVEIQNCVLKPLLADAHRIKALHETAMVRLRLLSEHLVAMIFGRLAHIWVYEHDWRYLSKSNRTRVLHQRHQFEDLVCSLLEEAMDDGYIAATHSKLATLEFLNLHNHTYQWARPDLSWRPSDLSTGYFRTLMLGFGATAESVQQAESIARLITADNSCE